MEPKAVAKVGLTVVLALALGIGLWFWLSHLNPDTYVVRVRFLDTRGLSRQSVVRMQGVAIGEVTRIDLDTHGTPPFMPEVRLAIKKEYNIPADSHFDIVSGILITTPQLQVTPGSSANALPRDNTALVINRSVPLGVLASLSPELAGSLSNLDKTVKTLNAKMGVTFDKLNNTLDSTKPILKHTDEFIVTARDAAASAKSIVADPNTKVQLQAVLANFRKVSEDAAVTSTQLSSYVKELTNKKSGPVERLTSKLNDVLGHIDSTLDSADAVVNKLTEQVTDPRFQQSLQETTELARTTLARFNQIATDLHELTGDPKLQNDLKLTVSNLRETTDKSQQVVDKFNTLLNKFLGGDSGAKARLRLPSISLTSDISEQFAPSHLRLDINGRFSLGGKNEAYLGLYDLGGDTRLTAQAGDRVTPDLTLRYGLYASKLGVGADYQLNRDTQFRADLWNTNQPRLDLRSSFRVNNSASVWIGADSLFRRTVPIVGVQLKN